MFEGSATTMLSSLDTVGSLTDDTLLWPGRRIFSVVWFSVKKIMFVCCGWSCGFNMSLLLKKSVLSIYSQTIRTGCIGNSLVCRLLSMVIHVAVIFFLCVHWLSRRSWVCRGQPAVCCWGWTAQHSQGKQISVGAAAARPEAVHGENDVSPLLCLSSEPSQDSCCPAPEIRAYQLRTAFVLTALLSARRPLAFPSSRLSRVHLWYSLQQSKGLLFSEVPIQNLD